MSTTLRTYYVCVSFYNEATVRAMRGDEDPDCQSTPSQIQELQKNRAEEEVLATVPRTFSLDDIALLAAEKVLPLYAYDEDSNPGDLGLAIISADYRIERLTLQDAIPIVAFERGSSVPKIAKPTTRLVNKSSETEPGPGTWRDTSEEHQQKVRDVVSGVKPKK